MKVNDFRKIKDVAITNDIIYLIDGKGHLFELQYHVLPNKYDDPCVEKSLLRKKSNNEISSTYRANGERYSKLFRSST